MEAIAAAAATILASNGYEALTTNSVAQRAGVSVGSLYEYFSDKDAIVGQLLERLADELSRAVIAAFATARATNLPDGLKTVTHAVVTVYKQNPRLYRELLARAPFLSKTNPLHGTERAIAAQMSKLLKEHAADLTLTDVEVCAAVAVKSGRALIESSCFDEDFVLDVSTVEPELAALINSYLLR